MFIVVDAARRFAARIGGFGWPVPDEVAREVERAVLRLRIQAGHARLDDYKRLQALDCLDGHWSAKPFRFLMYKLGRDDD